MNTQMHIRVFGHVYRHISMHNYIDFNISMGIVVIVVRVVVFVLSLTFFGNVSRVLSLNTKMSSVK